jgi:hypothetical protein
MSGSRRKTTAVPDVPPGTFPNIESLIDGAGEITIGRIGSIPCGATAADEDQCLAMLQRRPGETLLALLQRLDEAIASASDDGEFIDEINSPPER